MTKPWSSGGRVPGLAEYWAATLRHYLLGVFLVLGIAFVAGFRCARHLEAPDPAIAVEQLRSQALTDSLREERVRKDSLEIVVAVLQAHVAVDSAKAMQLHAVASRLEAGITVDTTRHFIPIAREPGSRSAADAAEPDTVAYADVQRPNDERHYTIPRFFVETYLAQRDDRNGLLITTFDQHDLIGALLAKSAVADSTQFASDSLNASLSRQVMTLSRQRKPWCGAKCGAVITLGVLTASAIALHEVRR